MFDVAIYSKTALGREELASRKLGVNLRLRRALIMIDGKTNYATLCQMFAQLGDPKQIITQLSELGLVESDHDLPPMPVFGDMLAEDSSTQADVQPTR